MKKLLAVIKNELIRYFVSPLAYVYLLSFLILNGSFAIYFGDFFNRGEANLSAMFAFQPWIYLLFVSGISMRLWAEEFHSNTIVQIATLPISIKSLVLGKFFAAWIFCGIALALTFPFWLTVNALGNPENSVILIGYFGSLMLAGCMLAVSQIMSALTKNQVIALVMAVIANLFFFWSGIEYILSFCRLFLPEAFIDMIASLSFISHFNSTTNGLVELRDIIFFASVMIFGNYTTVLIVNYKTAGTSGWLHTQTKMQTFLAWIGLLLAFFGINLIANNFTATIQYDATKEKIYTLSDNTKEILKNLPQRVTAKLYFSPILAQRNSDIRNQFENLRILLKKYRKNSNGKFEYKIYYPEFLSTEEDIALADGIQPIPLIDLNQNALFGMTLENALNDKQTIPFFAQIGQVSPEQEITSKLQLMNIKRKTLGVVAGIPVLGSSDGGNFITDPWEIINLLENKYKVLHITNPQDFNQNKIDVLLLFFPKNLPEEMITQIKQFSRNNGKVVVILDPAHEAARLYSLSSGLLEKSDLGELEKFWKFKFYSDYVVADLKNSITVDATVNYQTNPVFSQDVIQFKIPHSDMNPAHPITKNLNEIMMASASVITPDIKALQSGKITFYPLLRASNISSVMTAKVVIDGLNPQEVLQYFKPDNNQKILAAEIIGMEKDNPFDIIVATDSDFLYDTFWMKKNKFLKNDYITNVFDNANFLLNAVDYLAGDYSLIGLRGKRTLSRKFDDIEAIRRINSLQYKKKEDEIFARIDKAKQALQEVWSKKNFEERENFTPDELAAVANVRKELNDLRQNLSDLRYKAYENIRSIAARINFFDIWLIPLLICLLIFLRQIFKLFKVKHQKFNIQVPSKHLCFLLFCCLLILCGGILSVYLSTRSSLDLFENKPAFPQVLQNINNIDNISLKSNHHELTFEKQNGIWKLKQMPDLPVFQERIRRLLTTIAQATLFAKKSDKAENLAVFNLSPIEDKDSKAISVSLNSGSNIVQQFYLGNIDIDLGRGNKSAYIRFENQFQVWQIIADFIDMNLDWHNWTYSNLWDLRYGRIYDLHHDAKQEDKLAYLMKMMLNTPFIEITKNLPIEPIQSIKLLIENGNKAEIFFYKKDNKAYVSYNFDSHNQNPHLKLIAEYLNGKSAIIDSNKMEKIIEIINQ
ncbi:MAG: Gldg family protein [Alphaproteobacteria bacterium]|nr:Gldg family protein [Alphaproteobacteria bacterium]